MVLHTGADSGKRPLVTESSRGPDEINPAVEWVRTLDAGIVSLAAGISPPLIVRNHKCSSRRHGILKSYSPGPGPVL